MQESIAFGRSKGAIGGGGRQASEERIVIATVVGNETGKTTMVVFYTPTITPSMRSATRLLTCSIQVHWL